jgi:hypothetical protein
MAGLNTQRRYSKLTLLLLLILITVNGCHQNINNTSDPVLIAASSKEPESDSSSPIYSQNNIDNDITKTVDHGQSSAKIVKKSSTPDKANPPELEASIQFIGQFDLKKLGENTNADLFAFSGHSETFDINQDGHDDLIIPIAAMNSNQRHVPNEFSKPILLFWDNNIEEYIIDEEVQKALPFMHFPRRIRSSINSKTGLTEIFIADTGLDLANYDFSKGIENLPPNCGAQNHLITYDPSTGKIDEIAIPILWDYPHGIATGDLNGDQTTDYVLLNSPYIKYPEKCLFDGADYTNENYVLYSNNNGGFDKTNLTLNYEEFSKPPTITSGEVIIDENNNNFLVLGSAGENSDAHLYLFKQDSKASFTEISKVRAPDILSEIGNPVYGEILVADVDADGTKEVIAASNTMDNSIAMWVGRYIQLFDIKNEELKERPNDITKTTSSLITKGYDWCHHLFFNEQTSWNKSILTCTNIEPQQKQRGSFYTWVNNKLQLTKIKLKSAEDIETFKWMRSFYPVTLDQKTIFVGRTIYGKKIINGTKVYDSIKLYLIKPTIAEVKALVTKENGNRNVD